MSNSRYNLEWLTEYSSEEFERKYTYSKDDLGCVYQKEKSVFKLWTPLADSVVLNIYNDGDEIKGQKDKYLEEEMLQTENGVWAIEIDEDIEGKYYTFTVNIDGAQNELCDPYARACGVNGKRAMVIDLEKTNPVDWDKDKNPNEKLPFCESIIYEMHTRDFSINESSGIKNKGKFLGIAEENTFVDIKNINKADFMYELDENKKVKSGLEHIKELGVTHVHLLPFYDYATVDESKEYNKDEYNWGYDPLNYNVPEGSYSTDPFDGHVRIKELKETVQRLHKNGISVIMDVVYNHTFNEEFCFNLAVPGYFHRIDCTGKLSDGSACGNDTASERSMVSKYIVDSVLYWAREFHLDGFRFDLVGLIDIDTINKIREGLDKIRPNIMMYGEGWTLNTKLTKENVELAVQKNVNKLNNFAMFSDDIRDAMKGSVFEEEEKGFISGNVIAENVNNKEILEKSILGLPQWSNSPLQVINYTSCHDNYTLFDKIRMCNKDISIDDAIKQNLLAISIVMLSQGIPLMHAGEEILREKVNKAGEYVSDSVRESDDVNSIKWYTLCNSKYYSVYEYYKGIIEYRKAHKLFMMSDEASVKEKIKIIDTNNDNVIAYTLEDNKEKIIVVFSSYNEEFKMNLPEGEYDVYVDAGKAGTKVLQKISGEITVKPFSCFSAVYTK